MWWIGEHELCRWRSLQPSAPSSKTHLMNSQVTWKRSSLKQRFILNKQPILSTEGPCQEAQMMLRYQIPSHSSSHWTSEPWSSCMVVCALKYCVRMCCCLIACCPPALHRFTCCLALGFRVYIADTGRGGNKRREGNIARIPPVVMQTLIPLKPQWQILAMRVCTLLEYSTWA